MTINVPEKLLAEMDKEEFKKRLTDKQLKKLLTGYNRAIAKGKDNEKALSSLVGITLLCRFHEDAVKRVIVDDLKGADLGAFRKEVAKGKWGDDIKGFELYLMKRAYGTYGPAITLAFPDIELLKALREAVKAVYVPPPSDYDKTIQGQGITPLLLAGKAGHGVEGAAIVAEYTNAKYYYLDKGKYKETALSGPMTLIQHLAHTKIAKAIDWEKLKENGGAKITSVEDYLSFSKKFEVEITADEYMELTGAKSLKKVVTQRLAEWIDRLYNIDFVFKNNKGETYRGRLYSGVVEKERGGVFRLRPSTDFLMLCLMSDPADYHRGIYRVDYVRYPVAINAYIKLWWQYMINRGKAGAGMLKVKHLLAELSDLPKREDVLDRHYDKRIIAPLEKALGELLRVDALLSWEYSNKKREPLADEQLKGLPFDEWQELYIKYDLNLPDQTPYIEGNKKKLAAAKRRKEATNRRKAPSSSGKK